MSESQKKSPWCGFSARWREEPLQAIREELDDLRSRFLGTSEEGRSGRQLSPVLDISETTEALEATLDLPGVKAEEIDVRVSGQSLSVRGERARPNDDPDRTYHRRERQWGRFERTVTLPCAVQEDRISARYSAGVLTITLPKREESGSRKIQVESEAGGVRAEEPETRSE